MPPKKQEITPAALEKAFKLFDEDNSGFITADELIKIFKWPTSGGTEMSMKDAKEWIDRYDGQNGEKKDGMLSIKELAVALADESLHEGRTFMEAFMDTLRVDGDYWNSDAEMVKHISKYTDAQVHAPMFPTCAPMFPTRRSSPAAPPRLTSAHHDPPSSAPV